MQVDDDSDDDRREKKSREEQAWTQNLSRLIALWAQWFSKPFFFSPLNPIRNSASCKLLVLLYPQVCASLGLSNSSHLLHYWSSLLLLGCILRLVYKLVTCAANAVVGGGAWVGSTLFQLLLLRRQANDSQTVEDIYLSPIQVCSLTESNTTN